MSVSQETPRKERKIALNMRRTVQEAGANLLRKEWMKHTEILTKIIWKDQRPIC